MTTPRIELAERLLKVAQRHRNQFGLHPDNQVMEEAVKALQAMEQEQEAVKEPAITKRRTKKETEE